MQILNKRNNLLIWTSLNENAMDDVIPNRRTTYDWAIEIISFLGMIATCIPVFFYNKMVKYVYFPIH